MPRKSKRHNHLSVLASAKRSKEQHQVRRATLAELLGPAPTDAPASPTSSVSSDNTSSDEGGPDLQGPDLYTVELIYAKKTSPAGVNYYFVAWVGYAELTWQPASDLPQELIVQFEMEELGWTWPVDRRARIVTGGPTGSRGVGQLTRRSDSHVRTSARIQHQLQQDNRSLMLRGLWLWRLKEIREYYLESHFCHSRMGGEIRISHFAVFCLTL
ncbi:hypothetical protein PHYPSEUDO_008431 [Phytophthora pseudosyringae]|uniref:Chromo domain-containing protein n=1 Tax=Phytophthora pseudosyringae TaxID=221518 RepID=A0A8T1WE42_9STRA|nr:hypothetical protein PHYPSEUDO_008431 [Phytophthora pseudosyringae]